MSDKPKSMSIDEHKKMGRQIYSIFSQLREVHEQVSTTYGEKGEKLSQAALDAMEQLRTFMDLQVFLENPKRNGNANAEVYYAGGHKCHHEEEGGCDTEKCGGNCGQH